MSKPVHSRQQDTDRTHVHGPPPREPWDRVIRISAERRAASPSQIGRFETTDKNLSALTDLSGQWIDLVHGRRPPRGILGEFAVGVGVISDWSGSGKERRFAGAAVKGARSGHPLPKERHGDLVEIGVAESDQAYSAANAVYRRSPEVGGDQSPCTFEPIVVAYRPGRMGRRVARS